jgi:tRNA(Ile)-lysidine synthase
MLRKIKNFIKQNELLEEGDRIAVGVSGGADSICLLHVLLSLVQEYSLRLVAVHINHGIRGEEAARDEKFVERFCTEHGIEYRSFYYDVKRLASEEGLSVEEAGRKVRYSAFLKICREYQCNKLAIAHNKNDDAETFLFHLFRGSGIRGLSGMEAKRLLAEDNQEAWMIRPLLCVTREEIEEYLTKEGIGYIIDSSNLSEEYTRNKIRHRILSYAVSEINPQSVNNITEAAKVLKEIEEYLNSNIRMSYEQLVHQSEGKLRLKVGELKAQPAVIRKGVVRRILEQLAKTQRNLEAKHVEAALELMDRQVGKQVHLPYHIIAEREYEEICFCLEVPAREDNGSQLTFTPVLVAIPGTTQIPEKRKIMEAKLINYKKNDPIPKNSCMKWFDYDKIENAVEIRTRREGDFIQINTSGGKKKLKDYFIDHKIPKKQRDEQLLITDGSHVMWIPGEADRMSEKYKVDETTTKILLMNLIDMEE